jgi:undecaprenyl phosphate-alpha-L-ara4N flippase subunit ArnE
VLPYYISLVAGIAFGVAGQLVLKAGSARTHGIVEQFMDPWTLFGFVVYFLAAICYIAAIKKIPISIAYPTVAISYAAVAVLAHLIWGEAFGLQHVAGLCLIGGGIVVLYL